MYDYNTLKKARPFLNLPTKARTITNQWLTAIKPENNVVINASDAKRLGISDGDKVRVVSKSNPGGYWDLKHGNRKEMVGKAQVIEGMKPGVVGFCLGYGLWASGGNDIMIDGKKIKGDSRRSAGINCNAAMRLDDHVTNTSLYDPVGGSVAFYDTKVRLIKV